MTDFLYLLKQSIQSLKNRIGFASSVVLTMGITLGVLLCVLTLSYVLLLKPLPYHGQERLYQVEQRQIDSNNEHNVSGFNYPGLVDFYQNQQVFSVAALADYDASSLVSHPDAPVVQSSYVTPEWFELFNTKMAKGRYFSEQEGFNQYQHSAVISYDTWLTLFDKDEAILGKTVSTRNQTYTIIGVTAKDFIEPAMLGPNYKTDLWFPWDFNPTPEQQRKTWWGRAHQRTLLGYLDENVTLNQATALSSTYVNDKWQINNADAEYFDGWRVEVKLNAVKDLILGDSSKAIWLLLLSGISLVAIASVNIVNLFVSRFAERQHTLAIHASVGAKPRQLFWQLLCESGVLMTLASLLAFVIAMLGFHLFQQYLTSALPRVNELKLNWFTLQSALVLLTSLTCLFAWAGKKSLNFSSLHQSLTSSGKGQKSQVSSKLRHLLIVTQLTIALSLVFVSINVAYRALEQVTYDDGMKVENLHSLQLRIMGNPLPTREQINLLLDQLKTNLLSHPKVNNVSRSTSPLTGSLNTWSLTEVSEMKQVLPQGKNVDHSYFQLSGQSLLEGELFSEQDVKAKAKKIIINDTLANILAPTGSALGKRLSFGTSAEEEYTFTIIGVVKGFKNPGERDIPPRVYRPMSNLFNLTIELVEQQSFSKEELKQVLQETSSVFKVFKFEPLTELKDKKLYAHLITLIVALAVAITSIALTFIGLYGILSYSTQMRQHEIGTRMALGAKRKTIFAMIINEQLMAFSKALAISSLLLLALFFGYRTSLMPFVNFTVLPLAICSTIGIILISALACYLPLRQFIDKPVIYSLRPSE